MSVARDFHFLCHFSGSYSFKLSAAAIMGLSLSLSLSLSLFLPAAYRIRFISLLPPFLR
jgi:hypothetical protein